MLRGDMGKWIINGPVGWSLMVDQVSHSTQRMNSSEVITHEENGKMFAKRRNKADWPPFSDGKTSRPSEAAAGACNRLAHLNQSLRRQGTAASSYGTISCVTSARNGIR